MYRIDMVAFKAVQWMMTVYTVMGHRRKGRILEILEYWKTLLKEAIINLEKMPDNWRVRRFIGWLFTM